MSKKTKKRFNLRHVRNLCIRMITKVDTILDGFKGVHAAITVRRPDLTPMKIDVLLALEAAGRNYIAVEEMLYDLKGKMNDDGSLTPRSALRVLRNLWSSFRDQLNEEKNNAMTAVTNFIEAEILNVRKVEEMFSAFMKGLMFSRAMKDANKVASFIMFTTELHNWTTVGLLFLELMPQNLPPLYFFNTSDALTYYLSNFFEFIVINPQRKELVMKRFYQLAQDYANMGGIGQKEHLLVKNQQEENKLAKELFGWDGVHNLPKDKQQIMNLLRRFRIDYNNVWSFATDLGNRMLDVKAVTFYTRHTVISLYDAFVRRLIKQANSTFVQMRRTLFYLLSQVFGTSQLMARARIVLVELNIYFRNCIEVLRFCKKSIVNARTLKAHRIETAIYDLYRKVYYSARDMGQPYVDACGRAVGKMVHYYYVTLKERIHEEMVDFVIELSTEISKTGFHPLQLDATYYHFQNALSIYQGLMYLLQNVADDVLRANMDYMVACRDIERVHIDLFRCMEYCNKSLLGLKGKKEPTNWWFVLQRLPVMADLKEEICFSNYPVPFSEKPLTYESIIPHPSKLENVKTIVFDLRKLSVPTEDIVAPKEFEKLFQKQHGKIES